MTLTRADLVECKEKELELGRREKGVRREAVEIMRLDILKGASLKVMGGVPGVGYEVQGNFIFLMKEDIYNIYVLY